MSTHKGDCKVCNHTHLSKIQAEMEKGTPTSHIPAMFGNTFSLKTLNNHISNCLQSNQYYFVEKAKLKILADIENRFNLTLNVAQEALEAARENLLVDGQINFNLRAQEVKIVYEHPFMKDPNNKPLIVTETLEEICQMLLDNGSIKVKRTILKQEDARKTLRECIASCESILDRMAKLFAQRNENPTHQQYDRIRQMIEGIAAKKKLSFVSQLQFFYDWYGSTLRPDLRQLVEAELAGVGSTRGMPEIQSLSSNPLSASPTHLLSAIPVTDSEMKKSDEGYAEFENNFEKMFEEAEREKIGENFSEKSPGEIISELVQMMDHLIWVSNNVLDEMVNDNDLRETLHIQTEKAQKLLFEVKEWQKV